MRATGGRYGAAMSNRTAGPRPITFTARLRLAPRIAWRAATSDRLKIASATVFVIILVWMGAARPPRDVLLPVVMVFVLSCALAMLSRRLRRPGGMTAGMGWTRFLPRVAAAIVGLLVLAVFRLVFERHLEGEPAIVVIGAIAVSVGAGVAFDRLVRSLR